MRNPRSYMWHKARVAFRDKWYSTIVAKYIEMDL